MNRNRFLVELEKSLTFMEPEDRDAALAYYNELFDEAGADKEQVILDELGSPVRVAVQLNREYASDKPIPTGTELALPGEEKLDAEKTNAEGKTNTPWKGQTWRSGEQPPWRAEAEALVEEAEKELEKAEECIKQDESTKQNESAEPDETKEIKEPESSEKSEGETPSDSPEEDVKSAAWHSPRTDEEEPKDAKAETEPPKPENDEAKESKKESTESQGTESKTTQQNPYENSAEQTNEKKRRLPAWAIAIIAVFAAPVAIPLALAVFGVAVAILAVMAALVFSGVGISAGGIAVIISGIWEIGFLPNAIMMFGLGSMILAFGILLTWFMLWMTIVVFRTVFRRFKNKGGRAK